MSNPVLRPARFSRLREKLGEYGKKVIGGIVKGGGPTTLGRFHGTSTPSAPLPRTDYGSGFAPSGTEEVAPAPSMNTNMILLIGGGILAVFLLARK